MTVTLAFYKGRARTRLKRFQDWSVRFGTRGKYSHVELIAGPARHGDFAVCLSSSGRDGGVREKKILLTHEAWDLVELDIDPDQPEQFIRERIGARYDYCGIVFSQVLSFGRHSEARWFCSEICAAAIGINYPERISPQLLFDIVS